MVIPHPSGINLAANDQLVERRFPVTVAHEARLSTFLGENTAATIIPMMLIGIIVAVGDGQRRHCVT